MLIDKALRAHFRDEGLKHRIVRYLVTRLKDDAIAEELANGAADFDRLERETGRLAELYEWARFSTHPISETMREAALASLIEVRDEVRALRRSRLAEDPAVAS